MLHTVSLITVVGGDNDGPSNARAVGKRSSPFIPLDWHWLLFSLVPIIGKVVIRQLGATVQQCSVECFLFFGGWALCWKGDEGGPPCPFHAPHCLVLLPHFRASLNTRGQKTTSSHISFTIHLLGTMRKIVVIAYIIVLIYPSSKSPLHHFPKATGSALSISGSHSFAITIVVVQILFSNILISHRTLFMFCHLFVRLGKSKPLIRWTGHLIVIVAAATALFSLLIHVDCCVDSIGAVLCMSVVLWCVENDDTGWSWKQSSTNGAASNSS
jgi:hypothetical protein